MRKVTLTKFVQGETYTLKFGSQGVHAKYMGILSYGQYQPDPATLPFKVPKTTMGNLTLGEEVVFEECYTGKLLKFRKSHCPKGNGYVLSLAGPFENEQTKVLTVYSQAAWRDPALVAETA